MRSNLIYYAMLLGVGLAGLLLLLLTGHLKASNVVGFCIAFSNAYGACSPVSSPRAFFSLLCIAFSNAFGACGPALFPRAFFSLLRYSFLRQGCQGRAWGSEERGCTLLLDVSLGRIDGASAWEVCGARGGLPMPPSMQHGVTLARAATVLWRCLDNKAPPLRAVDLRARPEGIYAQF